MIDEFAFKVCAQAVALFSLVLFILISFILVALAVAGDELAFGRCWLCTTG